MSWLSIKTSPVQTEHQWVWYWRLGKRENEVKETSSAYIIYIYSIYLQYIYVLSYCQFMITIITHHYYHHHEHHHQLILPLGSRIGAKLLHNQSWTDIVQVPPAKHHKSLHLVDHQLSMLKSFDAKNTATSTSVWCPSVPELQNNIKLNIKKTPHKMESRKSVFRFFMYCQRDNGRVVGHEAPVLAKSLQIPYTPRSLT